MAYDEAFVDRIRRVLGPRPDVTERKMFGGIAFLLDGKMFCGTSKDDLMVRVGPDNHDDALRRPHARPMDFTGRPMKGYVFVESAGCTKDCEGREYFAAKRLVGASQPQSGPAALAPFRNSRNETDLISSDFPVKDILSKSPQAHGGESQGQVTNIPRSEIPYFAWFCSPRGSFAHRGLD